MSKISLQWGNELEEVFQELSKTIHSPFNSNFRLIAHAIMALVRTGKRPTEVEIVAYVEKTYKPAGGWIGFDHKQMQEYIPRALATLVKNPKSLLKMVT